MGNARRLGHFRSPEARETYLAAYERALAAWPTRPDAHDVETRFGLTHVQALGTSSGAPIVLLPAVAVSSPLWFRAVGALAARRPVYALDTITDAGRSRQTTPIGNGAEMSVWLDEVLGGLGVERAHLVGLSYGGWLALNQAQRSPGRLASVTAIDPPGAFGAAQVRPMLSMVPDAFRAKFRKSDAALYRLLASLNNGTPPPQPVLDLAVAGLRTFRLKQPAPRRFGATSLRSIRTPVLLLFCGASPVTHAARAADRARHLLPDVEVDVVAGAGHMLPVEDPEFFTTRLLGFIDRIEAPDRDAGTRPS